MPIDRRALGASGEELVARWYADQGYEVVARNWRCRAGELDVIAVRRGVMAFCEVKTRTSDRFGVPAEAVGPTKQARIRRLAARYLDEAATVRPRELRFDVASVLDGRIEILEGAF